MGEAEQPPHFDPDMPDGLYACVRCGSLETEVVSTDSMWCRGCRNFTTPQDREEWLRTGHFDPAYFRDPANL